ncbi:hypothetical protein EC968_008237, partial [Mortierella alpina]
MVRTCKEKSLEESGGVEEYGGVNGNAFKVDHIPTILSIVLEDGSSMEKHRFERIVMNTSKAQGLSSFVPPFDLLNGSPCNNRGSARARRSCHLLGYVFYNS